MRRRVTAFLLAIPLALAGAVVAAPTAAAANTGFRFVDIYAADGTDLKANVVEPTSPGRHPAIVFIASWGLNDIEYVAQANTLADDGYTVVSYTPRGFWGSGGGIDTAGPADIADVSTVIDWTIAHTTADPDRIGAAGVSYGAGISLIASAFDSRIKAVAAMSGWTDLVSSLYGGDTRRPQAVALLQVAATLLGHPSAELDTVLSDYWNNQNIDVVKAFGRIRSAATYLSAINANHPAILMANSYGDSLFPPDQLVDFYAGLTTPKRLELAPGDHAVVEATGLVGLDNHVWTSVHQWMDAYLRGQTTPILSEPPVVLRPTTSGDPEHYSDWAHVNTSTVRYGMGGKDFWSQTGAMGPGSPTGWSTTIYTGADTTAGAGVALLTNAWGALTGTTPTIWLPGVSRVNGAVWVTSSFGGGRSIRGIPALHLSLKSSEPDGTVVAYLYDYDALGNAHLVTHEPASWLGQPTNRAFTLDLRMRATAYTIPAGHSLALVIDTQDPLYLDANSFAAGITFAGPSWLDLPVR
jgi:predicted acyl esterase